MNSFNNKNAAGESMWIKYGINLILCLPLALCPAQLNGNWSREHTEIGLGLSLAKIRTLILGNKFSQSLFLKLSC